MLEVIIITLYKLFHIGNQMNKFKKILLIRDQVMVTYRENNPTYFSKMIEVILLKETIWPLKTVKMISNTTVLRNDVLLTRVRYCYKHKLTYYSEKN